MMIQSGQKLLMNWLIYLYENKNQHKILLDRASKRIESRPMDSNTLIIPTLGIFVGVLMLKRGF